MRTILLLLLLVAAAHAAGPVRVRIDQYAFKPARIEVHVGDTVTWENEDDSPHTVTVRGGPLASPPLDQGQRYTFRFTTPGTYDYVCALHPMMHGRVVVH
jgi:amicyanin